MSLKLDSCNSAKKNRNKCFTLSRLIAGILCLGSSMCLVSVTVAQSQHYVGIGIAPTRINVRDEGNSPLLYQGIGIRAFALYQIQAKNSLFAVELGGQLGGIQPRLEAGSILLPGSAQHYAAQSRLSYRRNIHTSRVWKLAAGGAWDTHTIVNYYELNSNNLVGYELNSSVAIQGHVEYTVNKYWSVQGLLQVPLVQYVSRPTSTGLVPFDDDLSVDYTQIVWGGEWGTWLRYRYVETHLSIGRKLKNYDQAEFFYRWRAANNRLNPALEYAYHSLGVSYHFNLNSPTP